MLNHSAFLETANEWRPHPSLTHLHCHHCHYNIEHFSSVLFQEMQITYPETIQRSVNKRQAEFLAGRYCARQVLTSINKKWQYYSLEIGINRAPEWPEIYTHKGHRPIAATISHTAHHAIAIASDTHNTLGLGVDIEPIIENSEHLQDIISQILNNDEQNRFDLTEHISYKDRELITCIFSVKESFFKAAYPLVKRYFCFSVISVTSIDIAAGNIEFSLNTTLHPLLAKHQKYTAEVGRLSKNSIITFVEL